VPKFFFMAIVIGIVFALSLISKLASINQTDVTPSDELIFSFLKSTQSQGIQSIDTKLAEWGKSFFFDPGFSTSGTISCSSCHHPEKSFSDGLTFAEGLARTSSHTPALFNLDEQEWFFWDGRSDSLVAQSVHPIEHPLEHGFSRTQVLRRLSQVYPGFLSTKAEKTARSLDDLTAIPPPSTTKVSLKIAGYVLYSMQDIAKQLAIMKLASAKKSPAEVMLDKLYSEKSLLPSHRAWQSLGTDMQSSINRAYLEFANALAEFQRSIRTTPSAFDIFAQQSLTARKITTTEDFSESHLQGLKIFLGKAQCQLCHFGPNLSDNQFHNTGLSDQLMRAQGILISRNDPLNCLSEIAPKTENESCIELELIDEDNIELVGAVRTPSLRNLALSAPYFHTGEAKNLDDVISFYSELKGTALIGHREESLKPFKLSREEHQALKSFLLSLSSSLSFIGSD
jgi:cytochrome c peroxidase